MKKNATCGWALGPVVGMRWHLRADLSSNPGGKFSVSHPLVCYEVFWKNVIF
jgi:hypothetical protein